MYFPSDQPADEASRPRAVLTLLHGYGGCGQDWFEQTSAARYAGDNGLVLIAPDCGNSFYHKIDIRIEHDVRRRVPHIFN